MNFDVKTEKLSDDQYVISLAGEVDLYTCLLYTSDAADD